MNSLNPYKEGLSVILDRVKWDLTYQSFRSRRSLRSLYNSQKGKKGVIVCNGPSLLSTDFDALSSVYTIGLNKINLLFPRVNWRPNIICCANELVIQQNSSFFSETSIPVLLDSKGTGYIKGRRANVIFFHSTWLPGFTEDFSVSVFQGYTVTYVAMQLAFYLGIEDLALVGCDHSFATKGKANLQVKAEGNDLSHFDPNYFAHGQSWQLPDLVMSELWYHKAKEVFLQNGRNITNCTNGGSLEIFDRKTLLEWIEK